MGEKAHPHFYCGLRRHFASSVNSAFALVPLPAHLESSPWLLQALLPSERRMRAAWLLAAASAASGRWAAGREGGALGFQAAHYTPVHPESLCIFIFHIWQPSLDRSISIICLGNAVLGAELRCLQNGQVEDITSRSDWDYLRQDLWRDN